MPTNHRNNRVLGVVPARGGSKGIPRKNLAVINGVPLIAYTLRAAQAAATLTRTVVSTDDAEIAAVARSFGGDVPFERPAELAGDNASTIDVVKHALREVEESESSRYDIVVLLQPTTPLRQGPDIDNAIRMLLETGADSVISVAPVTGCHPEWMKKLLPDGRLVNFLGSEGEDTRRRQDLPPTYIRNGALYVARRDMVVEESTFSGDRSFGYVMPAERSVNVDSAIDLVVAEHLLQKGIEDA